MNIWQGIILADMSSEVSRIKDITKAQPSSGNEYFYEIAIILSAVVLLTMGFIFWAVFIRKTKRKSRELTTKNVPLVVDEDGSRRRTKIRRRDHRPRNPTLAETGGLPPLKDNPPPRR